MSDFNAELGSLFSIGQGVNIIIAVLVIPFLKSFADRRLLSKFKERKHFESLEVLLSKKSSYDELYFRFLMEMAFSKYLKREISYDEILVLLKCSSPLKALTIYSKGLLFITFERGKKKFRYSNKTMLTIPLLKMKIYSEVFVVTKGVVFYIMFSFFAALIYMFSAHLYSFRVVDGVYNIPIIFGAFLLLFLAGFTFGLGLRLLNDYMGILTHGSSIKHDLKPHFIIHNEAEKVVVKEKIAPSSVLKKIRDAFF